MSEVYTPRLFLSIIMNGVEKFYPNFDDVLIKY